MRSRRNRTILWFFLVSCGCTSGIDLEPFASDCGDGHRAGIESCDDGNRSPGDGCSSICTAEAGNLCAPEPCSCDLTSVCDESCVCDPECPTPRVGSVCTTNNECALTDRTDVPPPSLVWQQRCLPYFLNAAPQFMQRLEAAAAIAASAWRSECSDIALVVVGTTDQTIDFTPTGTQQNVITFAATESEAARAEFARGMLSTAIITYARATGEIIDTDIALNGVNFDFSDSCVDVPGSFSTARAISFELGISLGFVGRPSDSSALLSEFLSPCDHAAPQLSPLDEALLCSVYPISRWSNTCRAPDAGYLTQLADLDVTRYRDQCGTHGYMIAGER